MGLPDKANVGILLHSLYKSIVFLFLLFLAFSPLTAQTNVNPSKPGGNTLLRESNNREDFQLLAHWAGGPCRAVVMRSDTAYITDGGQIEIINCTDSSSPEPLGSKRFLSDATGIALSGDYAYVTALYAGLRIIDISNPSNPFEVGFIDTEGYATDVDLSNSYAYVADRIGGLRIIDISDPCSPSEAGFYSTGGKSEGIALSENYAYLTCAGIRIFDISNPSRPTIVGIAGAGSKKIALSGNYAYSVCSNLNSIDISDPSNPFRVCLTDIWFNRGNNCSGQLCLYC